MAGLRNSSHFLLRTSYFLLSFFLLAGCGGATRALQPEAPASAAAVGASGGINRAEHRAKPYVILISFDGFKPGYLDRFNLPNFRRVMQRGVRARRMIPVFPSLTFPNHYSLVTGLYAERHGIVSNTFYDPARRQTYSLSDRAAVTDGSWYRGEPIWVTAESQGMVSGMFFWPGSEAAIKGVRPTYWKEYDAAVTNAARVSGVLEWLRLPEDRRPHILTLYFNDVDSASHRNPLDSPEIERAAQSLDSSLGALMSGIDALGLRDHVFLVLTSDHGMVETGAQSTIRLDSLVDSSFIQTAFGGPVANIHVKGSGAAALQVRDRINARLTHGRAWLREELPERYHYRSDPRAGDVVVVMDESWTIATSIVTRPFGRWGMHGWDPALPSMHALFAIAGPAVREGTTIDEVLNVDVYHLLTELLGLRAASDTDGQPGRIRGLVMR
jgi:predicted AlkP superfamily pyrophosphatase or phosphodiesterase